MVDSPLKVVQHDLGVDTTEAYIVPLSDLHIGASFDVEKFTGYRQWILDEPHRYTVIMGDVIDNAITDSMGDVYDSMRPADQVDLAVDLLRPLAEQNRILGFLQGNHEYRTSKRTDICPGKTICRLLGIEGVYDPDGIVAFLTVGHDRSKGVPKKNRITYSGFFLHGYSGGRKVGSKANALLDMSNSVMCDFYCSAHTHQQLVFPQQILVPQTRTKSLQWQRQIFMSAGSFQAWDGYPIRKGYSPTALGSPKLMLSGIKRDLHVSI